MDATDVLRFWFVETSPAQHFKRNAAFDSLIRERFTQVHAAAALGELVAWRDTGDGRLAEIIVLDQFSRNIFRDDPRAFATDGMALVLAQEALRAGAEHGLPAPRKAFLYMPLMHSESRLIHVQAERLFAAPGLKNNHAFELKHKAIIDRFGRYPHRNRVLGRVSTPEEIAFLQGPDASF